MDLNAFVDAAEAGVKMELKHPATGEPMLQEDGKTPISITLAGMDSAKWQKAEDIIGNRRLKTANGRNKGYSSMDEMRNDAAFMLAAVTLAWSGIVVDGNELECTPENAKKLYLRYRGIREQVDEFVGDRKNFLTASPQN